MPISFVFAGRYSVLKTRQPGWRKRLVDVASTAPLEKFQSVKVLMSRSTRVAMRGFGNRSYIAIFQNLTANLPGSLNHHIDHARGQDHRRESR